MGCSDSKLINPWPVINTVHTDAYSRLPSNCLPTRLVIAMDAMACSEAEAHSQLQQLRKERGFEDDGQTSSTRVVTFLDRALNM